jgi:hypothetical protein
MKLIVLALLFLSCQLNAQVSVCGPAGTPITTNPSQPVNNQMPSELNAFNWTNPSYSPIYLLDNTINATALDNPYYQTRNTVTLPITLPPGGYLDMYPTDGWELIKKDFGYDDQGNRKSVGVGTPMMVLYNKFRGLLRVFVAKGNFTPINGVEIRLKIDGNSASIPSLLDRAAPLVPLDQFIATGFSKSNLPSLYQTSQAVTDPLQWFYADFPMMYDPCTCFYQSLLDIYINFTNKFNLTLSGSLTGTAVSGGAQVSDASQNFSFGKTGKVIEAFNNADALKDFYTNNNPASSSHFVVNGSNNTINTAVTSLRDNLKLPSFLQNGLKSLPYLGAAMSIMEAFIGGGAGPQQVEIMPLTITLNASFSGNLDDVLPAQPISLIVPGS